MTQFVLNRQRLTQCREQLSLTKQEVAKRLQVSQPAYLRYESGERAPSLHIIQGIADVLGTSVEYLTDQSDSKEPTSYTVTATSDPELFQMIDTYKRSDDAFQRRMLQYYAKLTK